MNVANYEAEVAVLGAVLLDGGLFEDLSIDIEHFSDSRHKVIFQAMRGAHAKGQTIDLVTVTTQLGEAISQIGGTIYLVELAESVASTKSLPRYEQLVLEAYRNKKSSELAMTYTADPNEEALEQLMDSLQQIRGLGVKQDEQTTYDCLLEITDAIFYPGEEMSGCPTSYDELDEMTGGLQPGELIIVAARPSVGKTAFALNLAAGHCSNGGAASIFSLEMGMKQLLQRVISSEGHIPNQKWRHMSFNETDCEHALQAVGQISSWKLHLHEKSRTIADIRVALKKTVANHPEQKHIAIIDYLQLIAPVGRRERRDLEIGEITRELKLLAVELKIPIVLLSQLSRGVEQRQNKRPMMSDLRESGNIEQDADVIAFLYRDDYYNKESEKKNTIEIILAKQRNGPTGTVELNFFKEYGRFVGQGPGTLSYG